MGAKGRLIAVSISEKKGVRKTPVSTGVLREDYGLMGDAHAGTDRQVSLLASESIDNVRGEGIELHAGDFGENLTTCGIELRILPVGTRLKVGSALLEVMQIGKECHDQCNIKELTGRCVMPLEGVFAKVITSGEVRSGDEIEVIS